jgi:hypothetical protein
VRAPHWQRDACATERELLAGQRASSQFTSLVNQIMLRRNNDVRRRLSNSGPLPPLSAVSA